MTLLLTSLGMATHATIFWDDSFETCAVGTGNDFPCEGWDDFGQETLTNLRVVTEQALSGSKSVRLRSDEVPGDINNLGNIGARPSIYKHFPSMNHIFYRLAIRQKAGFVLNPVKPTTKIFRIRPQNTANDPAPADGLGSYPVFWLYNHYNTWAINIEQPCDRKVGGFWLTGPAPRPDQWDQIEVEIIMNTGGLSNGGLRMWVNNVLVIQVLDRAWVSATPSGTSCPGSPNNPYWHPSDWSASTAQLYNQAGNGDRFYDNIAVGSSRIGLVNGTPPPPPPVDTQAPSIPASLRAQAVSSSQINLTWNASTDNVGVTGYRIFRASAQIGTATGASYSNTGLSSSTAYSYTVAAYDAVGNASGQSAVASTTTHAAATGTVGAVNNLSATATGANSATLSFSEVTDGAGQPAKYDVRFSSSGALWGGARSVTQGTCATPLAGTTVGAVKTCTVLGLSPSTAYQFQLIVFRGTIGAGAVYGALSNLAGATTSSTANVMPPAKPKNLRTQ